jgi:lysophospholipase L1-like esterase
MPIEVRRPALRRWISRILLVAPIVILSLIVRQWAYVTTYRLYLDARDGSPEQSAAAQQFDIDRRHVVPRIVTRGADRLAFTSRVGQASAIHVELRPAAPVAYAIEWRDGAATRTLASGSADAVTAIVCAFPTGTGTVELTADGPVTWVDPRIVRNMRIGRHLLWLGLFIAGSLVWHRQGMDQEGPSHGWTRVAYFKAATISASMLTALLISEVALRAVGEHLSSGIAAKRHDLGEVTLDPRWEDSPRFGRRLQRRLNEISEWRYGDIVRMGFIPPAVAPGLLHWFRLVTDAEGFRNLATRERFDIAALGDSFTDAMTMAVEATWPSQLERRLGVTVQNYGTAGFGPQQELLVLKDYIAAHQPARVVLAFFAGNDMFDAEAFDVFQRSGGRRARAAPGWRIKDVFTRADTWYVVSALTAATAWLGQAQPPAHAQGVQMHQPPRAAAGGAVPQFDRGMFAVQVNERTLRWAFMPPYLNTLNFSEDELRNRAGWTLTQAALFDMQRATHDFGGEFVVMFLPFKSQVYWPVLERAMAPDALRPALRFYLDGNGRDLDLGAMRRNRLAQNHLMREFCERAHIPFVDTTDALSARVASGENVYYPDESHLNETGQAIVAETLAAFLRARQESGRVKPSRAPVPSDN